MMRKLKARKATVEADTIKTIPGKHHQTETHNARSYTADKNVTVKIDSQYPTRSGNPERPPKDSIINGDSAILSSRKKNYLGPSDEPGRTKGVFSDDVTIHLKSEESREGSLVSHLPFSKKKVKK